MGRTVRTMKKALSRRLEFIKADLRAAEEVLIDEFQTKYLPPVREAIAAYNAGRTLDDDGRLVAAMGALETLLKDYLTPPETTDSVKTDST
jgi:ABC-type nitrate/sulfonate/bicarbonate transport system substrate-binding protein